MLMVKEAKGESDMRRSDWNDGWYQKHLQTNEEPHPVRIPDDAMLREPRTAKAMGGLNVGWFEGRDYSYTKAFSLTEEQLSGALLLEFEGVYRKAERRKGRVPSLRLHEFLRRSEALCTRG